MPATVTSRTRLSSTRAVCHARPPTSRVRVAWADDAPADRRAAAARLARAVRRPAPGRGDPAGPEAVEAAAAAWRRLDDQARRRPQPGAGGARAQPGRAGSRSPARRATPTATRSPTASWWSSSSTRRARQGPRLPAAPGGGRHHAGRPVHPGRDLGARRRRHPPVVPRPAPAGRPTPPTASSTSTAPARHSSSRCACTPRSPDPGDRRDASGTTSAPAADESPASGQPTLTALQAAATASRWVVPAPYRSRRRVERAVRASA